MYRPNRWMLVEINDLHNPFYKVFGTWSGGYLDGDSWRLNSGIDKIVYHDDDYEFQGESGSIYLCDKTSYGVAGVSNYSIIKQLEEKFPDKLIFMSEDQALTYLESKR